MSLTSWAPTFASSTPAACPTWGTFSGTRNGTATSKADVFPSKDFSGTPQASTQPNIADYQNVWWGAPDKTPRTVRYTASFKAAKAGKYLLLAAASGGDKYTVSVDGKPVLEQTQAEGQVPLSATLDLSDGQAVTVVADYRPAFSGVRLGLGLMSEADLVAPEVKQYASDSRRCHRRGWLQ